MAKKIDNSGIPAKNRKRERKFQSLKGEQQQRRNVNMNKFLFLSQQQKKRRKFREISNSFRVRLSYFLSCCGGNRINLLSRFFRFVLDIIEIFCKRGGNWCWQTSPISSDNDDRNFDIQCKKKRGASKSIFVRKSGEGKWGKSVVVVGYGNWLHLRDKYSKLCYDLNQNETASFMLWQSELFSSCGGDKERLDNEISRMMKSEVAQFFKAFNTRREKRKINEMKRYFAHF